MTDQDIWSGPAEEPDDDRARRSLLAIAEQVSNSGSWAWWPDRSRFLWSENLRRMWQVEPLGPNRRGAILDRVHPDDRSRVSGWMDWLNSGHSPPPIRYRLTLPDGVVRQMQTRVEVRSDEDGSRLVVGWVQDITETRQAEREIACHLAVATGLSDWDGIGGGIDEGVERLLESLARSLGLARAALWVMADHGLLEPRYVHDEPGRPGVPIIGELLAVAQRCVEVAWRRREPVYIGSIATEPGFTVPGQPTWDLIRNGVLVPLTDRGETLAVLGLPGVNEFEITDRLIASLAGIGSEIGTFLSSHTSVLQPPVLTPREIEILRLASEGISGPAIAARLHVSPATVKTHFENIYVKYEVTDRVAAVAKALRDGLLH